jgi:isopenicillin N synthase-like dioxygenase
VPYDRNSYIINSGLNPQYLTNGYYRATNHRIRYSKEKEISILFFSEPSYNFAIDPRYLGIKDNTTNKINACEELLSVH